jgi:hypothetical protein
VFSEPPACDPIVFPYPGFGSKEDLMKKTGRWIGGILAFVVVAIVVIVLWPAADPLAGVETVAVHLGGESIGDGPIDVEDKLLVFLGDRHIQIVADENAADVVLDVTDVTVNLGDIEVSLSEGGIRGRASAICTLRNVRTGKIHVMDFHVRLDGSEVHANLVARKFWQVWKRRPTE